MDIHFREVEVKDRDFLLKANEEINLLSGLNDSCFEKNIEQDLFENKVCKAIIAEVGERSVGFVLYSYIYWANCGKGIYLSQAYVQQEFRQQGVLKMLLQEIELYEKDCSFITNLVGTENKAMLGSMEKLNFKSSNLITHYRMIK